MWDRVARKLRFAKEGLKQKSEYDTVEIFYVVESTSNPGAVTADAAGSTESQILPNVTYERLFRFHNGFMGLPNCEHKAPAGKASRTRWELA